MKHIDWLGIWSWFVHVWIIVFGVCGIIVVFLCKEFASVSAAVWISWVVGAPVATLIATIFFFLGLFVFGLKRKKEEDQASILKNAERMIRIAWMTGVIATIAALFSNVHFWGPSKDFSLTNIAEALITAALTYGFYKRQIIPALLLFLYFVFWKMALWGELQPKSITFAGMFMAVIFWRGIVAIARSKT
ncbi:MAG: hypothetical protein ACOY3I_08845 [Verrucomicrobiota bacterium]